MRPNLLLLPLLLSGLVLGSCDSGEEELPEVDCNVSTPVSYNDVRIFDVSCLQCHASDLVGPDRRDAPVGQDYDNYETARSWAKKGAHEVYEGEMPPVGFTPPTEDVKQEFYVWALCGTPP